MLMSAASIASGIRRSVRPLLRCAITSGIALGCVALMSVPDVAGALPPNGHPADCAATNTCMLVSPLSITISPNGGTFSGSTSVDTVSVTITWCDSSEVTISTRQILVNGTNVTGSFSVSGLITGSGGCHAEYTSTGKVTLPSGVAQVLKASVEGSGPNNTFITDSASATFTYTYTPVVVGLVVTADSASRTVATNAVTSAVFTVTNPGNVLDSVALTVACSAGVATGCSLSPSSPLSLPAGDSTHVTVNFTAGSVPGTGAIKLSGSVVGNTNVADFAETDVIVQGLVAHGVQLVNAGPGTLRDPGYCLEVAIRRGAAISCGDFRYVHALPSVRTYAKTRAPVLVYQSQTAHPFLIVPALVTADSTKAPFDSVVVQLKNSSGAVVDRVNLNGTPFAHQATQRVVLGYDNLTNGTSSATYSVVASSYPTSHVSVPNDSTVGSGEIQSAHYAHLGRGWTIAGIEQLTIYGSGATAGLLWTSGDGDVRFYNPTATQFVWQTTMLDQRDSITFNSTTGFYTRHLPHGAQVMFNAAGRDSCTIDRLGHVTKFAYTTATGTDIDHITLPVPVTSDTNRYRYKFYYNASTAYLDSVSAPAPTGGIWKLVVTHDGGGQLTQLTDPDGSADLLQYSPTLTTMVSSFRDKLGTWTTVSYDSALKVRTVVVDTADLSGGTPLRIAKTVIAQQSMGFHAALLPGVAHTTVVGPRNDTTRFWLDIYGGPTRTQDALGNVTLLYRTNGTYPGVVTRLRRANDQVLGATYDGRANLATETDSSTNLGGVFPTTTYHYTSAFDFVTLIDPPLHDSTSYTYDASGNRITEHNAADTASTIVIHYANPCGLVSSVVLPGTPADSAVYDTRVCNVVVRLSPRGFYSLVRLDSIGRDIGAVTPIDTVLSREDTTHLKTDALANSTSLDWAGRDTVSSTAAPDGQTAVVHNQYDVEGQSLKTTRVSTLVGSLVTQTHYDAIGRAVKAIAVDGNADSTVYDAAGNPITVYTRRSDTLKTTFDLLNRPTVRTTDAVNDTAFRGGIDTAFYHGLPSFGPGTLPGDTATFTYDAVSHIIEGDNTASHVSRVYFKNGLLQSETQGVGFPGSTNFSTTVYALMYRYDLDGRRDTLFYPPSLLAASNGPLLGYSRWVYDAASRMDTVVDPLGNAYAYRYSARGDPDTLALPGSGMRTRTYDNEGNLISEHITASGFTYRAMGAAFDARGKLLLSTDSSTEERLSIRYSGLGAVILDSTSWHGYDELGSPVLVVNRESFASDEIGNRYADTSTGGDWALIDTAGGWHHEPINELWHYQQSTGRLEGGGTPIKTDTTRYDAAGNVVFSWQVPGSTGELTNRASFYDANNRVGLTDYRTLYIVGGLKNPYTRTISTYLYNAFGRRVQTTSYQNPCMFIQQTGMCNVVLTTRIVWDGDQEIAEAQPSGAGDTGTVWLGLQGTIDQDPFYGRVLYTFGAEGTDHPLALTRIAYSDQSITQGSYGVAGLEQPYLLYPPVGMALPWNSLGLINPGFFQDCPLDSAGTALRCPQFAPQTDFYSGSRAQTRVVSWMGSLLQDKSNQDGTAYRRARVYDYETGRFTQEDPAGLAGGTNAYGFAGGDPVNYDDPFGLCPPNTVCPDDYDPQAAFAGLMGGMQLANTATPIIEAAGVAATAPLTISGDAALVTLGLAGKAASETATLFRGVSAAEAANVVAQGGKLRAGAAAAGNEGKYLTNTVEAAAKWAAQNGEGSRVLSITVPANATRAFTPLGRLDGIGQAWWAPMGALKSANVHVLQSLLTP